MNNTMVMMGWAMAAAVGLAVPGAQAQQLNQSQAQPFKPISSLQSSSSSGNALPAPQQRTTTSTVRSDASQRSASAAISSPQASTASSQDSSTKATTNATGQASRSGPVVDARGRLMSGAVQVGENRVMDPKTGRVYTTVPSGDGQRIIEPSKP